MEMNQLTVLNEKPVMNGGNNQALALTVYKMGLDMKRYLYEQTNVLLTERKAVPIWNKYLLTVEEAAGYFRIGECKLRKIITDNPTADFILWNGNRMQIKRKKFEEFIDGQNVI